MNEVSNHEVKRIRDYVNSQSPADDQAVLVQKLGSRRVMGRLHESYDVHCERSRWWVITEPTNLYSQEAFPQAEQALIFHLGLALYMAERSRAELPLEDEERIPGSWRRFQQAVQDLNDAGEAEDFQAIGIRCRDSLLAMARDHRNAAWLGVVDDPPKVSDFKGWGNVFAERLAEGRLRAYLKGLVDRTWDLAVSLQHNSDATPIDAELVLDATAHLLSVVGRLIRRWEQGEPDRCPRCGSYKLSEDIDVVDGPVSGYLASTICGGCQWQSEQVFTSWADHFEGADLGGYLAHPAEGPSAEVHLPKTQ